MHNLNKIKADLKNMVSESRYEHSLLVAFAASSLAHHYGLDENKAYVAGLTHDIAKDLSAEENSKIVSKYSLPKYLLNEENSKIIHAAVGAIIAKEYYNLDDEISNSIKYHTIGNANMTDFDKIIFIADKIGRKSPDETIERIRESAYENLDKAMMLCIQKTKTKLASIGKTLHPDTLKLLEKLQKNNF